MIVDVAPLPGGVVGIEQKIAIVVDVLRASSTVTAMLEAGAAGVIVAADPAEAFGIVGDERERYLICGESGGLPPAGFDYGNSPLQLSAADLVGREVVLSTSNGTRALHAVSAARQVLVGGGRNAQAVATYALIEAERKASDLTVVCAGDDRGTLLSLEDLFFAGYMVDLIARQRNFCWPVDESNPRAGDPTCWVLDESAVAVRRLYHSYLPPDSREEHPSPDVVRAVFRDARNGHTLPRIGYGADLEYCAQVYCSTVVPRLRRRNGLFVLIAEG
jgi:2-phosphosulfolactate phosphatase